VTIVHKGNIMKFTEGAFRDWSYALAKNEFGGVEIDGGPWLKLPNGIIIKDSIADAFLQQILLRPAEYDVICTTNLNGDYISDALAAQVGGIGIAPGAKSRPAPTSPTSTPASKRHTGPHRSTPASTRSIPVR